MGEPRRDNNMGNLSSTMRLTLTNTEIDILGLIANIDKDIDEAETTAGALHTSFATPQQVLADLSVIRAGLHAIESRIMAEQFNREQALDFEELRENALD